MEFDVIPTLRKGEATCQGRFCHGLIVNIEGLNADPTSLASETTYGGT